MATHYDITMGRDAHCEIRMGNDVAMDIHCDVTMSNDLAMCTYCNIPDWEYVSTFHLATLFE